MDGFQKRRMLRELVARVHIEADQPGLVLPRDVRCQIGRKGGEGCGWGASGCG